MSYWDWMVELAAEFGITPEELQREVPSLYALYKDHTSPREAYDILKSAR